MIPLSMVKQGEKVKIMGVRAGKGLSMRLANMGFYPGTVIEVISNRMGPLIVARGGVRFGIGHGMALKIMVQPLNIKD